MSARAGEDNDEIGASSWTPAERIELQERTIEGLRAEVNRAVQAIPGRYFRDGEPWEQGIPRMVDEYAAVLRRVRTIDHKFGPFPELEPLGELLAWAETVVSGG